MRSRRRAKEAGIIGYGRFGRCAARHLRTRLRVTVADTRRIPPKGRGIIRGTVAEAASKEIVILAVPINRMRSVLRSIAPHVRPGAVVIDVCSVKELPVRWMKSLLPPHVEIVGTHPLFGPDSAEKSLEGRSIVITAARSSTKKLRHVVAFCRSLGLRTDLMTPAAHDRLMARSLFLTQLIGRATYALGLPLSPARTRSYDQLLSLALTARRDTPELFRDMYRWNRFARRVPGDFARSLGKLTRLLSR